MKPKTRLLTVEVTERHDGRLDYKIREPGTETGGSGSNCTAHDLGDSVALAVGGFGMPERPSQAFARMVSDLDRCEHGRHQGDVCGSCAGDHGNASIGNPALLGITLGWTMGGKPYRMPDDPRQRHDPAAWLPEGRA